MSDRQDIAGDASAEVAVADPFATAGTAGGRLAGRFGVSGDLSFGGFIQSLLSARGGWLTQQ